MKILVRKSNPLRDLLSHVKEESLNPNDMEQLKDWLKGTNQALEIPSNDPVRQARFAGKDLTIGELPNNPNFLSNRMKRFRGLDRFGRFADEQRTYGHMDEVDELELADILSGKKFDDMEWHSPLGEEYDAIRDNTQGWMQDIESEYEKYKKLMSIIGNPIMGFKDFAQAKGWIQPNEGLTFDDRQLLEQIREGTPPPMHPSQIGDMSLQEFDRKVPVESYTGTFSKKRNPHHDFMNLLKASILHHSKERLQNQGDSLGIDDDTAGKELDLLIPFYKEYGDMKKEWMDLHNSHSKTLNIDYFDYDDSRNIFNDYIRDVSFKDIEFDNKHKKESQSKSLVQMQDFVSHPKVANHIEKAWDEYTSQGPWHRYLRENHAEAAIENMQKYTNDKTDPFTETLANVGVENMPYLPNYQQKNMTYYSDVPPRKMFDENMVQTDYTDPSTGINLLKP